MVRTPNRPAIRSHAGFTLVELLLVVSLVALLGLLAYPGLQSLILKARRSDARTALLQLQQHQERWRAHNPRYAELSEIGLPAASALGHYRLAVAHPGPSGYELMASATGSQQNDALCKILRIVQAGGSTVYASGPDDTTFNAPDANRRCWPQ